MAIFDHNDILADRLVVTTKVRKAQKAKDFNGVTDFGMGQPIYVACYCQGNFTHDLRVQAIASNDGVTWTIVVADSGVYPKAELTFGKSFSFAIPATGRKYRFLTVRFIPSTNGVDVTDEDTDIGEVHHWGAPNKVGETIAPIENAIRAQLETVQALDPVYPYANDDKFTV